MLLSSPCDEAIEELFHAVKDRRRQIETGEETHWALCQPDGAIN
jgi:hypothetical protein